MPPGYNTGGHGIFFSEGMRVKTLLKSIVGLGKDGLKAAADVLLPRLCIVCGCRLNRSERHLCLVCRANMPLTYFWERSHNEMADRLNRLIEGNIESYLSDGARERYAYATALFFYDGSGDYRRIPHQLKYHGNLSLGRDFGRILGRRLKEAEHFMDVDMVIPVPLHWTRKWKRGYNQAEVIAVEVADVLGVRMQTDFLKRTKRTRTQTKIDPAKKSENVKDAFTADLRAIMKSRCHHILIIDDVFTSGSTLYACFSALREVFPPDVRISIATLGFVGGA